MKYSFTRVTPDTENTRYPLEQPKTVDDPLLQGQSAGAQGLFGGKGNKLDLHGKWERISVKSGVEDSMGHCWKGTVRWRGAPQIALATCITLS